MIGPLGLAAWFGLLVTALNLMPIGQLDGGHVTYALSASALTVISRVASWVCVALVYFGPSWLLWAVLLRVLGRRHPPTLDDAAPVGRARVVVGVVASRCSCSASCPTRSWSPGATSSRRRGCGARLGSVGRST